MERYFQLTSFPWTTPNGKCSFAPQVSRSMEDIADELADWVNGKPNRRMDKWYKSMYPNR